MIGAIVAAAGPGSRLGASSPKALVRVGGRSLVAHAVASLVAVEQMSVVVTAPAAYVDTVAEEVPVATVIEGGVLRQDSVRLALDALPPSVDIVLVHDAARPFVPRDVVQRVIDAVRAGAVAVVPVLPLADTVKQVDDTGDVVATVPRSMLRAAQTPQGFVRDVLVRAHAAATGELTDDAALVEALGLPVSTVAGSAEAFKVTTPFDLVVAEALLARRVHV